MQILLQFSYKERNPIVTKVSFIKITKLTNQENPFKNEGSGKKGLFKIVEYLKFQMGLDFWVQMRDEKAF